VDCRPQRLPTLFFSLIIRPPPRPPLFPYTTLFRSPDRDDEHHPLAELLVQGADVLVHALEVRLVQRAQLRAGRGVVVHFLGPFLDRKSTRLNSSHLVISYAVFCLKKKKKEDMVIRV